MVAKAGLGIIGLGAISIGGIAFTKPEWLGINKEIIWKPLSQDSGFDDSKDPYKGKLGSTYKNYLVGTSQDNKAWWDEKVKNIKEDERKGKFKNIDKGFEGNNSLKSLCDEAYKKSATDLKEDTPEPKDTEFRKSDVWKFCSVGDTQPKTLKEETTETYSGNQIGQGETEREKLLSTKDNHNDWIWDLKDKEFESATVDEGFFKIRKDENKRKTIKDICKEAYGKEENGSATGVDKITKAEVAKYCSLEKIATM